MSIMEKLYQDITDIEIILVDPSNTLSIHAHKHILGCSSTYFHNLFCFGKEKTQSSIRIEVDNAKIAHDVIISFYGQKINSAPDSKYLLEMFKCRNFFCLDNDVKLLYNIKVSTEEFNLLMRVVEEFDVNDKQLMSTIKKNIPLNYDLNNFSVEFINELHQTNNYRIISGSHDKSIKIWNAETGLLLNTLNGHTDSAL